jgi:hypothetical protein
MDLRFLNDSVGKSVRLERGGPDKLEGKLLAIMDDAIAVQTNNEGVVYVNCQHIKTISESVIPEIELNRQSSDAYTSSAEDELPPLIEAVDFQDLLCKLKHRLVRVNHGGPNSLQGVLIEIRPDVITILHEMKDYVHYPIYHIKSITWILNTRSKQEAEEKDDKKESEGNGKGKK